MALKQSLKKIFPWAPKALTECEKMYASFLTVISPTLNTKYWYKKRFKRELDLNNPKTLNEKVLWLKLNTYYKNPLVIQCADKYAVREYIKDCGCEELLVDAYGAYDKTEDIEWEDLPQQFVLKWNFGAGMNIICPDKSKMDKDATLKQLKKWGKRKYWLEQAEMQYKYAPRKIVCEKYLSDGNGMLPLDYKVYCFNGKAQYVLVCVGREYGRPKFYFFDRNWQLSRINRDSKMAPEGFALEKPACIDKIFAYAEKLAAPFPFVRVDFYAVDDKPYFGELTFTPAAGLDSSRLPETDILLGNILNLEKE